MNSSSETDFFDYDFSKALYSEKICKYLFGFIIAIGIFGNIINIRVFGKRSMLKEYSFRLILCLSIVDLAILLIVMSETLVENFFQFDIRSYSVIFCKFDTFMVYFLSDMRNIYSVGITIHRAQVISNLINIQKPAKIQPKDKRALTSLSSPATTSSILTTKKELEPKSNNILQLTKKANTIEAYQHDSELNNLKFKQEMSFKRIYVVLIVVLIFFTNFHFILFLSLNADLNDKQTDLAKKMANSSASNGNFHAMDLEEKITKKDIFFQNQECMPKKNTKYEYFLSVFWIWIDFCVYFLIPFLSMSISFVFIFIQIRKFNRNYFKFLLDDSRKFNWRIYLKKVKINQQILIKLLMVNSYFFVSILPYFVLNMFAKANYLQSSYLLKTAVDILFFSNNALNIFFYGISSKKYRQELFEILKFYKKKVKKC
jgi:hypothetical protein